MKTAIVTGATGFIGRAFINYLLERDYQVFAVSRNIHRLKNIKSENLICIEADLSDYKNLNQRIPYADIFYHFAWEGAYGPKTTDYHLQMLNAEAACEALEQAVKMHCNKFVLAGTIAELEILAHLDNNICAPRGTCIYAMAKLSAEMMCKTLATKYGILFNSGLFANIIGPGDYSHRSTNTILHKFINGQSPKLVKGDGLNDWLFIKDAVCLIEAMGEHGKNMKSYYIGHTELWPLRKIIEKTRDIIAPEIELYFGEIADEFLTDYSYISTKELLIDTGCEARYSFDQAVCETTAWVRSLDWE